MNKHIALLALSLGACSEDPRLEQCDTKLEQCEEQLGWATTAWEECSSLSRKGSPFNDVRARECADLQELVAKTTDTQRGKINTILDGCERVIDAQKKIDEEDARRAREAQRKAFCEGANVSWPE